jgi:tripartite-type tricarboxylate transporter receptor subunit TctC
MKISFCKTAMVMLSAVFILSLPAVGGAEFPERPIQALVGWPAGSLNDMLDRPIAQVVQKILRQPVIIQNVPGGGGALVLGRIKITNPDGYTLFQTGSAMYSRVPHMRSVPYDPLKDFDYLVQHSWFTYVIEVLSDSPWKTFEELIAYGKANPKKLRYTTPGMGTSQHLMMTYIAMRDNLEWIHVPFNSSTEQVAALLGGHVEINVMSAGVELEHIRAGRIRPLLVLLPKRDPLFPETPSVMEKGYDFSVANGPCWAVPAGTPKDIRGKLESALLQATKDPMVVDIMKKWNMTPDSVGSESLTKIVEEDYKMYGELLKKLRIGIYKQ